MINMLCFDKEKAATPLNQIVSLKKLNRHE